MSEKCFACDRKLGKKPALVRCADEQTVYVGRECLKHVKAAGTEGWLPPKGGPRLYLLDTPGLKAYWPELSPTPSPDAPPADMIATQEGDSMPKTPTQHIPDVHVRVTNGQVHVVTGRRRLDALLRGQDQVRAFDIGREREVMISRNADGGLVATDVQVTH